MSQVIELPELAAVAEACVSHIGQETSIRYSVTGEEYVVMTAYGIKDGAGGGDVPHISRDKAICGWLREFVWYVSQKGFAPQTLYWRTKPRLEGGLDGYRIYSRFLVSDRHTQVCSRWDDEWTTALLGHAAA